MIATDFPACFASIAALNPAPPEPTTTTSKVCSVGICSLSLVLLVTLVKLIPDFFKASLTASKYPSLVAVAPETTSISAEFFEIILFDNSL